MHTNYVLFLLSIPKQGQEISPCSCSRLSLPGRGHVLVRCSHTVTGLRTLFLFLLFLDLLWNSLFPSTPYIYIYIEQVAIPRVNWGLLPCVSRKLIPKKCHQVSKSQQQFYCNTYFSSLAVVLFFIFPKAPKTALIFHLQGPS